MQVHNDQAWEGGGECVEAKQHSRPWRNVFWGSFLHINKDVIWFKIEMIGMVQDVEPAMDVHKKMVNSCCKNFVAVF